MRLFIICASLLILGYSSTITVQNNLARSIEGNTFYLPQAGVDYAPIVIKSGESDVILIDNDNLYTVNYTQGVICMNYMGSSSHVCVGWNITNDFIMPEGQNTLGLYWGTEPADALLWSNIFVNQNNVNYAYGKASAGWLVLFPSNNIKVSAFMASDMSGDITLILDEYKRRPFGQFYIQNPNNNLFIKSSITGGVPLYDSLDSSMAWSSFATWYIQPYNGNSSDQYVIVSNVHDTVSSTGNVPLSPWTSAVINTNNNLRTMDLSGSVSSTNSKIWFEFKHVTADFYTIRSVYADSFLDADNCDDGTTNYLTCAIGRRPSLSWNYGGQTTNAQASGTLPQFRLVPVDIWSKYPTTKVTSYIESN